MQHQRTREEIEDQLRGAYARWARDVDDDQQVAIDVSPARHTRRRATRVAGMAAASAVVVAAVVLGVVIADRSDKAAPVAGTSPPITPSVVPRHTPVSYPAGLEVRVLGATSSVVSEPGRAATTCIAVTFTITNTTGHSIAVDGGIYLVTQLFDVDGPLTQIGPGAQRQAFAQPSFWSCQTAPAPVVDGVPVHVEPSTPPAATLAPGQTSPAATLHFHIAGPATQHLELAWPGADTVPVTVH